MLSPCSSPMPQAVAPCPHAMHARLTSQLRATPSGRGARCQAQAGLQLEQWQQEKLATAYAKGKRHISIQELSREVELERSDVLQYLREFDQLPDSTRESLLQSRRAAVEAAQQRQATVADAARGGAARSRERFHYQPGLEPHTPRSAPWAANFGQKKMPRSVEATLERIFERTSSPTDAMVASLWDLHRLPKRRALDWFAQRRRERAAQRRAGQ